MIDLRPDFYAYILNRQMLTFQMSLRGTNSGIHLIGNKELRAQLQVFYFFCFLFVVFLFDKIK